MSAADQTFIGPSLMPESAQLEILPFTPLAELDEMIVELCAKVLSLVHETRFESARATVGLISEAVAIRVALVESIPPPMRLVPPS